TQLLSCFTEGWQFSRLYLRISAVDPSLLSELKSIDEISYCYVMAKIGQTVSLGEAKRIVQRVAGSEHFGLLVWSFGRMRLWRALKYIGAELPSIGRLQQEVVTARIN